ncbi:TauD/TfdA family dioxygenase [Saccharothrix sp. S26]|uniref:TauD/TfdA family dioxygenase n=1 Tax=Saccharothrix sp. S26 TaxID=2907215 RepID=UPI001F327992|nr:TauD/TfdA family dioxygenase [Saccharothrix sp. S26]MCE6999581.1 TauD/TfdA family dioxygenase [Saccharothrix sp. S26]
MRAIQGVGLAGQAREVHEELIESGYAVFRSPVDPRQDLAGAKRAVEVIVEARARPIAVFRRHGLWREIGVRPERDPLRSEGVGRSPLHLDFVNAADPPDLLCLLCVRSDPRGGGHTSLAPTDVVDRLPARTRRQLARPVYSDGVVVELDHIGHDVNPFAVFTPGDRWRVRYTDNLRHADSIDDDARRAVEELSVALHDHLKTIPLRSGDVILVDQHRYLHGKTPLGAGQADLPEDRRRLLLQMFGRARAEDQSPDGRTEAHA